jgi:hypothetical protein
MDAKEKSYSFEIEPCENGWILTLMVDNCQLCRAKYHVDDYDDAVETGHDWVNRD